MSKTIQAITNQIWSMANELRGNMDASEYKNYILAFMFYRYLSEHQERFLVEDEIISPAPGETVQDAYAREAVGNDLVEHLENTASHLGYAIEPEDTWARLVAKIDNSEIVASDYQTIFDHFNANVELNRDAMEDFRGVFNDINLGDSRLGNSTVARAKSLNSIVKLIDSIEYKNDEGKDILGEIYEYLIGQFAASAGKKVENFIPRIK